MSRPTILLPLAVVALAAVFALLAAAEPFVDLPLRRPLGVLAILLGVLVIVMALLRARRGAS